MKALDFNTAAADLLRSVVQDQPFPPEGQRVLNSVLTGFLVSGFPELEHEEVADLVQSSLERYIRAASEGRVDLEGKPGGYLLRTAQNAARDLRRDPRRSQLPLPDDEAAAPAVESHEQELLERMSGETDIERLQAELARQGRYELVALIEAYLQIAATATVTTRSLGQALGISHTEAGERLRELRELMRSRRDFPS